MVDFNLDIPKIGYFIVYKKIKGNFYHRLIAIQQIKEGYERNTAEYIHIEPSLGGEWGISAQFPFIRVQNLLKKHKGQYIKIVKPKLRDYENKRKNVAIHCISRVNLPYGLLGILWFKLKKVFKNNFLASLGDFCSELCGFGLYSEYVLNGNKKLTDILPKDFSKLYPADFLNKKYFEVVWEGYLPK